MPVAKSAGHLTGGHKVRALPPTGGMPSATPLTKPAYSSAPVAPTGMSQMGAKALGIRAKKVLAPLSDPTEAP